jgi:hypothetical protein
MMNYKGCGGKQKILEWEPEGTRREDSKRDGWMDEDEA